tara:strand:- start:1650 stop:2489 length:840 start_codon:yes stop_codon:yes gene_type:complete
MGKIVIFILIFFIPLNSCSKKEEKISIIEEKDIELQMIAAYKDALKELEAGDGLYAAKKFNEAEILYPQSEWAPRSLLMAAYSLYAGSYYYDAISELERYIKTYPNSKNISYAHFLLAMCYYESIVDEKKDMMSLLNAQKQFNFILETYPDTDFAMDAKFKLGLITDVLASKEMYIGRYYIQKEKWIPAINRFKNVINKYGTTIFAEEALHRLVEIHYKIGLINESEKYASLLGYNYQSSEWYAKSYKVFNKEYNIQLKKNKKKNKKFLRKRLKKLFKK